METDHPLRILIVEDVPSDAELAEQELRNTGLSFMSTRVETKEGFLKALEEFQPEMIISDYAMPEFDGMQALRLSLGHDPQKPFIVFTGSMNEETAVACMKAGATDYVIKDHLSKLPFAVREALENKKILLEKEAAERALMESEERYRYLFENANEAIFVGLDSKIVFHNPKTTMILGYPGEEFVSRPLSEFIHPDDRDMVIDWYVRQIKGEKVPQIYDFRIIHKAGNVRWVVLNSVVINWKGRPATLNFLSDITERKEAEEVLKKQNEEVREMTQQLWQASRLATLGELSASIAHELNNPLATVNLRVESLLALIPTEDPKRRALEVIEQEVDRMANLVANLLQFSRRSQPQISTVDVCQEINNTLDLILYHLHKYGVKVQRDFSPDIPYVHADPQQLRQLFLNLFTNSSDAMPQGGTLTIRVYMQESEAEGRRLEVRDQKTEGEAIDERRGMNDEGRTKNSEIRNPQSEIKGKAFVVVEIMDTGVGISSDVLPKVMEPFFTNKPEGKGTGLGLPICRRIAHEHNGIFEIFSEGVPGRGTTVHISLPIKNGMNVDKL